MSERGPGVSRGDQGAGRAGARTRSRERPSSQLTARCELNLREPDLLSRIRKKYMRKHERMVLRASGNINLDARSRRND